MVSLRAYMLGAALAALAITSVACGGGGGAAADGLLLGLVSGGGPSRATVSPENPLDEPATVRALGASTHLRFDAASLPSGPVQPGARFACEVIVTPTSAGEIDEQLALEFTGSSAPRVVAYRMRATVEALLLEASPATLEFGSPPFGANADRTLTVRNRSSVSTVTFLSASFPSADASVLPPAFPLPLGPGETRSITVRWAPLRVMQPTDATASLNASGPLGSLAFRVRVQPTGGTAILDLGTRALPGGLSELLEVDVPAEAWALQVEAWREKHPVPDNTGGVLDPTLLDPFREQISLAVFTFPDGSDHSDGWMARNGAFAACLPRSPRREDQLTPGGGRYRFQLRLSDPPAAGQAPVVCRVRVLLKATPDGTPAAAGTLDLNLWIDTATGLTAATAATDPWLQTSLTQAGALLQQVGITLGDIDYYECPESVAGATESARWAAIRAAMLVLPAQLEERVNLFVGNHAGGVSALAPGCATARSNHSVVRAGYLGNLTYIITHEILHYLGLLHLGERPMDVFVGGQPANIMDPAFGQTGTSISAGQGAVVRAHPLVR